jgi:hypothetical protein
MSAMVSMRGLMPRDLVPVGGVAVTRDTVNHWLLDSMCCDGYHVPRSYNCLQPLCVPAAFPRLLLPGVPQFSLGAHQCPSHSFISATLSQSVIACLPHVIFQRLLREAPLAASPAQAAAAHQRLGYGLMVGCLVAA